VTQRRRNALLRFTSAHDPDRTLNGLAWRGKATCERGDRAKPASSIRAPLKYCRRSASSGTRGHRGQVPQARAVGCRTRCRSCGPLRFAKERALEQSQRLHALHHPVHAAPVRTERYGFTFSGSRDSLRAWSNVHLVSLIGANGLSRRSSFRVSSLHGSWGICFISACERLRGSLARLPILKHIVDVGNLPEPMRTPAARSPAVKDNE
jgi:hypothetical protein